MTIQIIIAFLCLLFPVQTYATVLSDAAAALAPGTWSAPLGIASNLSSGVLRAHSQFGSAFEYQDKVLWNPVSNSVMVLSGVHGSPPVGGTDGTIFWIYSDSTNLIRSSCDSTSVPECVSTTGLPSPIPSIFTNFTCTSPVPPSGTGCGLGHGYHEGTIDTSTGDYYHRYHTSVTKFSQATQTWSDCSGYSASSQVGGSLDYFPERNSLIYVDADWGLWELSLSAGNCLGTWVQRAKTFGSGPGGLPQLTGFVGYHNQAQYSSTCKCLLMVDDNTTNMWRMNANATFTQVASVPLTPGIPQSGAGAIFTKDPVTNKILMWQNSNAQSTMYEYDPVGNTWTTIARTAPPFPGPVGGVAEIGTASISAYGVIMFITVPSSGSAPSVRLYKHAAGTPDTTAPTDPSSLTATAISPTRIDLGWTGSTDAVGVTAYLIERCTPAACVNFAQINTSGVTTFSDTAGLVAGTLYRYRVRATDASGNLSGYSNIGTATTSAADVTAPTAPSSLVATAVSASQINLAFTASTDAVGVTLYRIERSPSGCGAFTEIGTSATNSFSDTGLGALTAYCYKVRASDAALNLSSYSGTSSATTSAPAGGGDFATRCAAAGVIRCFGFDTSADLGGTYGNNFGNFNNAGACDGAAIRCPVIDTTLKASGAGSMKFTQPSQSGAGAAGQWFTNFSANLSSQFGASGEFWIQWRQRFDTAFVNNVYTGGDGEGPKTADISGGDSPGCTVADNTNCRSSNVDIELVVQDNAQRGYAQMYGFLERSGEPQQFSGLGEAINGGNDFKMQSARPYPPGCLYSMGINWQAQGGNCIGFVANEWMTFKIHVKVGTVSGPYWAGTLIEMFIGREGQALQPAITWTGNYGASSNKFGKIWLLPYITSKDASQVHPIANTWYDELIISTQNIADPGGSASPALVAPTSVAVIP